MEVVAQAMGKRTVAWILLRRISGNLAPVVVVVVAQLFFVARD